MDKATRKAIEAVTALSVAFLREQTERAGKGTALTEKIVKSHEDRLAELLRDYPQLRGDDVVDKLSRYVANLRKQL